MGISDKDYADAIEHQRAHQIALMKLEILKQKEEARILRTGPVVDGVNTISGNPIIQEPYGHFKVLSEEDLQNEAMKAPLSSLVDMWLVKWSGEWVNENEFKEDDFWRIAFIRLSGANKLEKHNLANQYQAVYRIIE